MKSQTKKRVAGTFGVLIGLPSIISGSAVLLGIKQPEYIVLLWLVVYNVVMGFISVAAGVGIWLSRIWGKRLSMIIASAHTAVLLILILFYVFNISAATESIGAMVFRAFVWIGITLSVMKDKAFEPSYSGSEALFGISKTTSAIKILRENSKDEGRRTNCTKCQAE